jgi:aspartate/methionine/tyrosine aminotransferase
MLVAVDIAAASVVALNEPLCVRQFVSSFDLDSWNKSLNERLKALADEGAAFLSAARKEENIDSEEYSDWFVKSEDVVHVATDFFEAFRYARPSDLTTLKNLMDQVPAPSDEDPDSLTDDYESIEC